MTNPQSNNLTIREFTGKDPTSLLKAFNEIFIEENPDHIPMDENFWNWKYRASPDKYLIITAEDTQEKIVGMMGVVIRRIKYHDQYLHVYNLGDVCVQKEFRNRGFIAQCLNSIPRNNNLIWGFPGEEFWDIYPKLIPGSKNINIKIFYKKTDHQHRPQKNIEAVKTISAETAINSLWNEKAKEIEIGVIRNWQYIKWMVIDSPLADTLFLIKRNGETIGYFVTRQEADICLVIDILILNDHLDKETMQVIKNTCLDTGSKEIRLFVTDPQLQDWLTDNGFCFFLREEVVNRAFFAGYDPNNKTGDLSNIHLTWLDSDWCLYDEVKIATP